MSLFGGDSSAPSLSESEFDNSLAFSPQSSPSIEAEPQPLVVQYAQGHGHEAESGVEIDILEGNETDSGDTDSEPHTRSNRFKGRPNRWKEYTAADRQLAESIEQAQSRDLAAHLYNAHALKRRARLNTEDIIGIKTWQGRDAWLKTGSDLEFIDITGETQRHLVPPKSWTAWPLPPGILPPIREPPSVRTPSQISGWVIGLSLAYSAGEEMQEELLAIFLRLSKERWATRIPESGVYDGRKQTASISRSRSHSIGASSSQSKRSSSRANDDDYAIMEDREGLTEEQHIPKTRKKDKMAQSETNLRPTILADDTKAFKILQPTINSVLNDLDSLALAVCRTRLNHYGSGNYERFSQSELASGAESADAPLGTKPGPFRARRFNRKLKSRPGSPTTSIRSNSDKEASDTTGKREEEEEEVRVGALMDWSDVLGLATINGWSPQAIARTAQRCATLFEETMSFIPLDTSPRAQAVPDLVRYVPSAIPGPSDVFEPTKKRPYFRIGTTFCPHIGCEFNMKETKPWRLREHIIKRHKYDPKTNDSDNEDRAVGGVHIDGFLEPIAAQQSWPKKVDEFKSVNKRKKLKVSQENTAEVSGEGKRL